MYALRCTRSLLARFRKASIDEIASPSPATTVLGDWYANDLNVGRHRLILCTSARSLLTVVVPARDLTDLPRRVAESAAVLLASLGVRHELIRAEVREMQWIQVARTESRSVLGSMNDFAFSVDAYFRGDRDSVALQELDRWLADTPCKPLQFRSPAEVAGELMRAAS
ncbi:MAG TPA: hypothetical protein VJR92_09265 [Gemmatimonadaceae bacterium]|nr:hypothetical protein [Gemmatimonadaceae bacterium]